MRSEDTAPHPIGGLALEGLAASDIEMAFGGVKALDGVALHLAEGSWTGLIGPNGSGKTTMLNVLSGVYEANAGRIVLQGKDMTGQRPQAVARAGVVRTFQHPQLATSLTLQENVELGLDLLRMRGVALSRGEQRDAVADALGEFGCARFANLLPDQAPYGARKAAEIARAIVARPKVLLLDEPAAGLSREERTELVRSLQALARRMPRLAVCLVEHDVQLVAATCSRLQALNFGKVIAVGPTHNVLADPQVREAYLGKSFARVAPHSHEEVEHAEC